MDDNNETMKPAKTMYHNDHICPVCGEEYTNWVDNGYRNGWPTKSEEGIGIATVKFETCTPSDSDYMYIHTENVKTPMCGDGLASLQDASSD